MLDIPNWITIGIGVAFALAGLHYYGWVFGIGSKLDGMKRIRMNGTMARLKGRHSERDPAVDVEQALNDVLKGAPDLDGTPDEGLWIPEVRKPMSSRQRDAS
ncbi:MAG: hypothetical protein Rubg2KO_26640 [Rubricoccaceae bacterium]